VSQAALAANHETAAAAGGALLLSDSDAVIAVEPVPVRRRAYSANGIMLQKMLDFAQNQFLSLHPERVCGVRNIESFT